MKFYLKEGEEREQRADEQKLDIRRDDTGVEPAREGEDLFIKGYVL